MPIHLTFVFTVSILFVVTLSYQQKPMVDAKFQKIETKRKPSKSFKDESKYNSAGDTNKPARRRGDPANDLSIFFQAPPLNLTPHWNISLLRAPDLSLDQPTTIEDLVRLNVVFDHRMGCLSEIQHRENFLVWFQKCKNSSVRQDYLPGTTMWVNEFMQMGHAQYDLEVMQVLSVIKVRVE